MTATDPLVVFQPSGKRGRFAPGTPVLDAARTLGVAVESVCGGRGICGKCQVSVAEGKFAKFGITSTAEALTPPGFNETRYAEKRGLEPGRRLSCSTEILSDVVIDVAEGFVVTGQTIRKDASTVGMRRNPALVLAYVELPAPTLEDSLGDADRLAMALEREFGHADVLVPFRLLAGLQPLLLKANWQVTAALDLSGPRPEVIAVFPGYHEDLIGLAVDIGSTTIAAHLVDLMSGEILGSTGRANPQIRFGEDLMSRVSYVMMNEGGRQRLTEAVRGTVNEAVDELLATTGAFSGEADAGSPSGNATSGRDRATLLDAVFVANPVMHHLFLGLDPTPLGQAPFHPAVSSSVRMDAQDIGIGLGDGARVHLLPIIAGHVGADAAAVVLAQRPQDTQGRTLIVDVGTNAEIVLWDGARLYAASSPTGPAFEGAEISSGQRAAPGAIERLRIDRDTLAPKFRVIGAEQWSDEDGFAPATGVTGICGSGIIEIVGEMFLSGILSADGIIRGPRTEAEVERLVANGRTFSYVVSAENPRLEITQTDVRAIQLAKAALHAGVRLLMDHAGIDAVDDIRLAGAFGSYIDPAYAMLLGLVPDCPVDRVSAVGNAAGQGALIALLDREARGRIEATVQEITKIETALEPAFQQHFVDAMGLPNSVAPFPNTRAHFGLPPLVPRADGPGRSGGRRRRGH